MKLKLGVHAVVYLVIFTLGLGLVFWVDAVWTQAKLEAAVQRLQPKSFADFFHPQMALQLDKKTDYGWEFSKPLIPQAATHQVIAVGPDYIVVVDRAGFETTVIPLHLIKRLTTRRLRK